MEEEKEEETRLARRDAQRVGNVGHVLPHTRYVSQPSHGDVSVSASFRSTTSRTTSTSVAILPPTLAATTTTRPRATPTPARCPWSYRTFPCRLRGLDAHGGSLSRRLSFY